MTGNHLNRRALLVGALPAALAIGAGSSRAGDGPPPDEPTFEPFNRLPPGRNLAQTRAFLLAEGFTLYEVPRAGDGCLRARKFIGGDNTEHHVAIEFKAGYSVSVLEMAFGT